MNDFSQGSIKKCIIAQAIPLTLAQIVQMLYNLVDRIYIGHMSEHGDLALTGVGITFPIVALIGAFTGLFGNGGTPLFSIARGRGEDEEATKIMGNSFVLLVASAIVLSAICYIWGKPILFLFGASEESYAFAHEYLQIYLVGTIFSMISTGMNGYINAQGFPRVGMLTTVVGAVINIVLDPIFIFVLNMGVRGAALATVISQAVSAAWVLWFLLGKKALLKLERKGFVLEGRRVGEIMSLGVTTFVMRGSNSLVQIVCNRSLQMYGGDLYVGIMTIINSVREIVSLPIGGITNGAQPVLGYNYGAKKNDRVKEGIRFMTILGGGYTVLAWIVVLIMPKLLFRIFTEDEMMIVHGAEMLNIYFFGFFFMAFQFAGQSTFQALGKSKQAIFFSLFRKVVIVVPLTMLLPMIGWGVHGVFWAEPISNFIGGLACFVTMWRTLYRKL